jgi:co-chaperonin GroES (HSP10)
MMTNTQTRGYISGPRPKLAAEAAEAEPVKANIKRKVSDEEWEAQMPKPSGYHLLIALPDVEEYYHDSTLLKTTDQMHKEYIMSIMGIVIDMGADAYSDKDRFPEGPWCKEGDYVMFRMNTGTRFRVNGKEFRLMNDDSVEAVIPDPRGIMAV